MLFSLAITDLASAYLKEPAIKTVNSYLGLVAAYPHGENEFNLGNDIEAANVVMR